MQQAPLPSKQNKIFFPNLNGLRFVSFFVVFLYHCYLSFYIHIHDAQPVAYDVLKFLFKNGYLGVNFFFVLSGFLITYLLIKEKEVAGQVHVGNFYLRRIFRIWPLFYLAVLIGFVLHPLSKILSGLPTEEPANWRYYLIFAANFDYINMVPVRPNGVVLPVLWSVCVEEQFYLTWPIIFWLLPLKRLKWVFFFIIGGSLLFRSFYTECSDKVQAIRYFHTFSLIGDMALGGLFAYFCSYESKFKRFVTNMSRPMIIGLYVLTLSLWFFREWIFQCGGFPVVFERFCLGICFGMIIVEQNYSKHSFYKMERFKTMSKLGVYTYGLYCLHLLGITAAYKLIGKLHLNPNSIAIITGATIASLILSIGISLASYHFFEKWFLKIKSRFEIIPTSRVQ